MNELTLAKICASLCQEKKAENVVILDLEGKSPVADYFVICSGFSDRQVSAVADHVIDQLKEMGVKVSNHEGMADGRWALLDFGSVLVHIFQDQLRDYYHLESLWADAPRIRLRDENGRDMYSASDFGGASLQ